MTCIWPADAAEKPVVSSAPLPAVPRPCRLNGLRRVSSETLLTVNQVTQLDVRDNGLSCLDLSPVGSLESLHCQRNHLGTLTLSGFTLRTLNASSNRKGN